MIERRELDGPLKGKVEITIKTDGRTTSFITTIGSDSDLAGTPVAPPLKGRRFATYVEEMNTKLHPFREERHRRVCEELHDKTGKVAAAWKERGGTYCSELDSRGKLRAGPVIRSDREMREYVKVHNEVRPRGRMLHEA